MPSFPLVSELPPVLDSTDWSWQPFDSLCSSGFWMGIDPKGTRWLTKLRGPEYAYREIVFDRLAQRMGWSCQSTIFLRLSKADAALLGVAERIHGAHWLLSEHPQGQRCAADCSFDFLLGRPIKKADDLVGSNIKHLLDCWKGRLAACLFGGNEPPGRLITTDHEFVIIDAEQMFATKPCPLSGCEMRCFDGGLTRVEQALALEVCLDLAKLTKADLDNVLTIPEGIRGLSKRRRDTASRLRASHQFACDYVKRKPHC